MANLTEIELIALFDMDGTLCDYNKGLSKALEKLKSPEEPIFNLPIREDSPGYIKARADLIRMSVDWWANLEQLQSGFDLLELAKELGFHDMILTKGPRKNPYSWTGKKIWIDRNLAQEEDISITTDKGLTYGKMLVDDSPEYIERWLSWRERGLVIMPATESNKDYTHPQVIRYDGTNLSEVRRAMIIARDRKRGESLILG